MRINMDRGFKDKKSVKDLDGFASYGRTIIISSIKSSTIPNIIDLFFNLGAGGTDFIPYDSKKTRVIVINNSEVYGSYHGLKDTRTRNVYIHHGMADCDVDQLTGDTPIYFVDMDYNVIVDTPSEIEHGNTAKEIGDVKLSYDEMTSGGQLFRNTNNFTKEILMPSPDFYDEKDMVLIGGREENYFDILDGNKQSMYYTSFDNYKNGLYTSSLNKLQDNHTRIFKLNITIDNLTKRTINTDFNNIITELVSEVKYALEHSGFSSAEIIFGGTDGFNINNIKSYLPLSNIEKRFNYLALCSAIESLNYELFENTFHEFTIMLTLNHANVHVNIVDRVPILNSINKTDSNVLDISTNLKTNMSMMEDFHLALDKNR